VKQALDYDLKGEYIKQWIPELRDLQVLNAQGDGDEWMLLKLYQPFNLELEERVAIRLEGADFVKDPLMEIKFSIDRKRGRGQGQGRG
jgi:deoxyribodipyrimidine photo-lyase